MTSHEQMLVLARVVQDLAFLDLLGPCLDPGQFDGEMSMAVDFKGNQRGTVVVAMAQPVATAMARNMLGLEDHDNVDAAMLTSAAGELANVVAGNLIPHIATDGEEIKLDAPRPVEFPHRDPVPRVHVSTADGIISLAVLNVEAA